MPRRALTGWKWVTVSRGKRVPPLRMLSKAVLVIQHSEGGVFASRFSMYKCMLVVAMSELKTLG